MILIINGHDFHYALESLIRVFYPDVKVDYIYGGTADDVSDCCVVSELKKEDGEYSLKVRLIMDGFEGEKTEKVKFSPDEEKNCELVMSNLLYEMLTLQSGYIPQWGLQTGVRPSKLFFKLEKKYGSLAEAHEYMVSKLHISSHKIALTEAVCANEKKIIESSDAKQFSLYVSIPFCPSRCSYCSFISHSVNGVKKLIPRYVELLCREIEYTAKITENAGLHLRSVYIGGGTPTVLSADDLKRIIKSVKNSFNQNYLTEFTVEAGRPDTLTDEKLEALKNCGVERITINAQSFNDDVLQKIGRNHTGSDVYKAYERARKLGFNNINTDLIAGLPDESVESFLDSVKSAVSLGAENITVHTLALKRSSFLITRDSVKGKAEADTAQMIESAGKYLNSHGYKPYYMYRQSRSIGNLENTGWCIENRECEYNIFMMEEVHSVFGVGAGAVTRLVNTASGKIERVYNYKYPYEYTADFYTILGRKDKAEKIIRSYLEEI